MRLRDLLPKLPLTGITLLIFDASLAFARQQPQPVDTTAIDEAICWLMYFQQGSYGALLMAVAGIGAVVTAALGNYKTAINLIVVGVGSWLIEPVAVLMFDYFPQNCGALLQNTMPIGG
jgi:hypothetical protein